MPETMTKDEKALVAKREGWLKKKKMSPREFAESVRLDYNTIIRWFNEPRVPQRLMRERVAETWPDFPVK